MAEIPDGVFDLVRAICTVSAMKIMADIAIKAGTGVIYENCPVCLGCGLMTCPRCDGTKTLMARPKQIVRGQRQKNGDVGRLLLHRAQDATECPSCGPPLKLDVDMLSPDVNDAGDMMNIASNIRMAALGQQVPLVWSPAAGTIMCPGCCGKQRVRRASPNFAKLFGPERDMWTECCHRQGLPVDSNTDQSVFKERRVTRFREYPYLPPFTVAERRAKVCVTSMLCPLDNYKQEIKDEEWDKISFRLPYGYLLPLLTKLNEKEEYWDTAWP